jgi:hypothetical protein
VPRMSRREAEAMSSNLGVGVSGGKVGGIRGCARQWMRADEVYGRDVEIVLSW